MSLLAEWIICVYSMEMFRKLSKTRQYKCSDTKTMNWDPPITHTFSTHFTHGNSSYRWIILCRISDHCSFTILWKLHGNHTGRCRFLLHLLFYVRTLPLNIQKCTFPIITIETNIAVRVIAVLGDKTATCWVELYTLTHAWTGGYTCVRFLCSSVIPAFSKWE